MSWPIANFSTETHVLRAASMGLSSQKQVVQTVSVDKPGLSWLGDLHFTSLTAALQTLPCDPQGLLRFHREGWVHALPLLARHTLQSDWH